MAYNVLKGAVEGSVDQHGDQEIEGIKVFKSVLSASVFYDTDAQSPCATENKVAFDELISDAPGGIITSYGDKKAKSHFNFTFDGKTLRTNHAIIRSLSGSGAGLCDVPAQYLSGKVAGTSINFGKGLESFRGALKVKTGAGLLADDKGVSISLFPNGGLDIKDRQLSINPHGCLNIQQNGQNISDPDLLLVFDASRGEIRHTTLQNLYEGFINFKVPHASGNKNNVQFKGTKGFEGTQDFTYEPSNNSLNVKGTIKALNIESSEKTISNNEMHINGALYKSITTVTDLVHEIQDTENTILVDSGDNPVTIILPRASENVGRVITFKKIPSHKDKFKLKGNCLFQIKAEPGELIDFSATLTIKSNYAVRTLQSDGTKWWIINRTGS